MISRRALGAAAVAAILGAVAPASAVNILTSGGMSGRNLIVNGNFAVNQRGYANGGTLAAGPAAGAAPTNASFGHDHWYNSTTTAQVYNFTQATGTTEQQPSASIDTIANIASGVLLSQRVEHVAVAGGSYVLGWVGTATCGVTYYNGSSTVTVTAQAASPESFTLPAGVTPIITCTNGGLTDVQLEASPVQTLYERRGYADEFLRCQRYYQVLNLTIRAPASAASQYFENTAQWPTMRIAPVAANLSAPSRGNYGSGSLGLAPQSVASGRFGITSAAAGDTYAIGDIWSLIAEF